MTTTDTVKIFFKIFPNLLTDLHYVVNLLALTKYWTSLLKQMLWNRSEDLLLPVERNASLIVIRFLNIVTDILFNTSHTRYILVVTPHLFVRCYIVNVQTHLTLCIWAKVHSDSSVSSPCPAPSLEPSTWSCSSLQFQCQSCLAALEHRKAKTTIVSACSR